MAEAILWLLVLAVPLAFLPTARDAFTLPKLALGEWLALASLLVLAGGAAATGRFSLARPLDRPAVRAVLPLLAAAFLAWLFTAHRAHADQALAHLAVGAAAVVGWSAGLDSRRLRRLLTGLLVPASLLALLGILQFHGIYRIFAFAGGLEEERQGVTSLAGNPGHLGGFLALALVVGLALLRRRGRNPGSAAPGRSAEAGSASALWRRAALAVALVLVVYGLVVTQTLAALAASGVGLAAVALLSLPRRRAAVLLAVAVVAAVLVVVAVEPLRERVEAKAGQLAAGEVNVFLTGRLDGWRAAAWMVAQHPGTGVGPGAYVTEFNVAKTELMEEGAAFYPLHVDPTFASAHNELLQVAAEWGLVGLLAVLWAVWVVARAVVRVVRRGRLRGTPGDPALALGGLVVLAVLSLFHFPFRLALTAYPALLWTAWVLRRSAELETPEPEPEPAEVRDAAGTAFPRRAEGAVAWTLVVLLAAGLFVQTVHSRDLLRSSRIVNTVQRTTVLMAARGQVPGTLLWANLRLLREAEDLDPTAVAAVAGQGAQYLLLERPEEAAEAYRRALDLEPRPELWLGLGRARWAAGERREAVEDFARAVRLHPRLRREVPEAARSAVGIRLREAP